MRRLLVAATCAVVLSAAGAFAGEVKGSGGQTGAPAHANSNCAYSGLNDFDPEEGQNVSHVQTAADSWKIYGFPKGTPGQACRGGSNEGRE